MTTKTPDAWRAAVAAGTTQAGYWDWEPAPEPGELRPFLVYFDRNVTSMDTVRRVIYAHSFAEARKLAGDAADEFNSDCPDDISLGTAEADSWDYNVSSGYEAALDSTTPVWAPADA